MEKIVPWFEEGLRFHCTGCGKCCTGAPGYVFLSPKDIETLSLHFQITTDEFTKKYVRQVEDRLSLIDAPGTPDCVFLKDNRCSVYEARPIQCKTFPWWVHQIKDSKSWEEAGKHCEGINHPEAPLIDGVTIGKECLTYLDNLLEQNFSFD